VGIDAREHRARALEELIVQAHANATKILFAIDQARLCCGPVLQVVNGTHTARHAEQVAHELHHAAIRAPASQRQRECRLAQPRLGNRQMEQHFVIRRRRGEDVIQREVGFVRLAVDELAAHVEMIGQCADRVGTR